MQYIFCVLFLLRYTQTSGKNKKNRRICLFLNIINELSVLTRCTQFIKHILVNITEHILVLNIIFIKFIKTCNYIY